MVSNNSSSGGIGFAGLLTILFIGLKLTNHIDWSWWWIGALFVVIILVVIVIIAIIEMVIKYLR